MFSLLTIFSGEVQTPFPEKGEILKNMDFASFTRKIHVFLILPAPHSPILSGRVGQGQGWG
jgi:hypothetical protein